MKVGTIGSGVIVDRMIEAMKMTQGIEVCAVYSRTLLRAQEFAQKHHISKYYDDLDKMLNDDDLDTIYVASPNGLHYSQSKQALLAGKHVICEKPFVPTVQEAIDLFTIAKEKKVYIFEAITTIHLPNYKITASHLKDLGDIKMIQCNFSQYSSRYEKYKAFEVTNVFDPAFSGGSLMDINVYCIHFVVGLLENQILFNMFAIEDSMGWTPAGLPCCFIRISLQSVLVQKIQVLQTMFIFKEIKERSAFMDLAAESVRMLKSYRQKEI